MVRQDTSQEKKMVEMSHALYVRALAQGAAIIATDSHFYFWQCISGLNGMFQKYLKHLSVQKQAR